MFELASHLDLGRRRGFSLLELVLVLAIIGVLAAIAAPRMASANAGQQLESAARRVIADLELARTRADAASQTVTVSFDLATASYTITAVGGDAKTTALGQSPYGVKISSADFAGGSDVSFNGFGMPQQLGQITLANASGTVTLDLQSNGEVKR